MSAPGIPGPGGALTPIAGCRDWDVVVIGAGPAGATAAHLAAAAGRSVLLVERQSWPRAKVCGGCLNARTLRLLGELGGLPADLGVPVQWLRVYAGHRTAPLPLPQGRIVDRAMLDAWLVHGARGAGAVFAPCCRARIGEVASGYRRVDLVRGLERAQVHARLVIDAGGLTSGQQRGHRAAGIRIGFGQILPQGPAGFEPATIHMVVGSAGYVGLVRLADGRLNVAACLRAEGRPRRCAGDRIDALLAEAGLPPLRASDGWRGTPALRRLDHRLWQPRVLRIGDAAGFWEPFTGEGIGWAIESALQSHPAVLELAARWSGARAQRWAVRQRKWLWRCYRHSRRVARFATRPVIVRTALTLARKAPRLIDWLLPGQELVCTRRPVGGAT